MERRKFLIGAGTLGAGASVALGTGAFTTVEAQRNVDIGTEGDANAQLAIQKLNSANADDLVSTENDGTLSLTIPNVNRDAVTQVEDLFRIVNQGTQSVSLFFRDDSNAVTFRISGSSTDFDSSGESLEGPNNSVALDVGEEVEVGLTIDTLNNSASGELLDNVTIVADAGPPASAQNDVAPEPQYVVDGNGDGDNRFKSIQAAIDQAGDETAGSVFVEPSDSEYEESVSIDVPGLTLTGSTEGEVIIDGRIEVSASDVVVDGFTVRPPDPVESVDAEGIRIGADDVVVQNNIVENFAREPGDDGFFGVTGILAFSNKQDAVENPTIRNNLVQELKNTVSGGATGIGVQGNVVNATIEENTVEQIGQEVTPFGFGITVRATGDEDQFTPTNVVATDNQIADVVSDPDSETFGVGIGVEASGAGEVDISGNSISNAEFLLEDKTNSIDLSAFAESNTLDRGALLERGDFEGEPGEVPVRNVIFDSIRTAQGFAKSDDTIELLGGTYEVLQDDGPLKIKNSLTAIEGTPTVEYNGGYPDEPGLQFTADDLTISGVQFNLNGIGPDGPNDLKITGGDPVISVTGAGATIRDTEFRVVGTFDGGPGFIDIQGAPNDEDDTITIENIEAVRELPDGIPADPAEGTSGQLFFSSSGFFRDGEFNPVGGSRTLSIRNSTFRGGVKLDAHSGDGSTIELENNTFEDAPIGESIQPAATGEMVAKDNKFNYTMDLDLQERTGNVTNNAKFKFTGIPNTVNGSSISGASDLAQTIAGANDGAAVNVVAGDGATAGNFQRL